MNRFDWVKEKNKRKALPYAAAHAQETAQETYEEFKAITSGWNDRRSHALFIERKRQTAVTLFSLAAAKGFIDC